MATQNVGQVITGIAGADLSTAQYKFVKLAADGEYDLAGNGAQAEGVAQNDPAAQGRALAVATAGIVKVVVGTGGLTAGDDVASGAAGVAITAASGDAILGVALDDATVGTVGRVLLNKGAAATV